MRCLTSARFTMQAEVLHWQGLDEGTPIDSTLGHWESAQDPITGEVRNVWVPGATDNPETPEVEADTRTISCLVRGIVDGGIRVAGNTERFGDVYENMEYLKMWTPPKHIITKRDRITNIRAKRGGKVIWVDDEVNGLPTVFNVNGVTPLFDAFNRHIENFILLERAPDNIAGDIFDGQAEG